MAIAAVPDYLRQAFKDDFKSASPGLRFGMLFKYWGEDKKTKAILWGGKDQSYRTNRDGREIPVKEENKRSAIDAACDLRSSGSAELIRRLNERAAAAAHRMNEDAATPVLELTGYAVAPFATGLGNEHPLENGFAFLNPYGIPYLAGSGVKGVLRTAARQLAAGRWGECHGWSSEARYPVAFDKDTVRHLSMIDILFGLESEDQEKEHLRGVLAFWDVVPTIAGDALRVEVMTAHQSDYYQKGDTPHESGSPNPIYFLTVPPDSEFAFRVACDLPRLRALAPELAGNNRWKDLLTAALRLAFAWIGFGAKTAVGYGAFTEERPTVAPTRGISTGASSAGPVASVAPRTPPPEVAKSEEIWSAAKLLFNPGTQSIVAEFEGKKTTESKNKDKDDLFAALGIERADRLRKKKSLPGIAVRVRKEGNLTILVGLADPA